MTTMEIVNVCAMSNHAIERNVRIGGTDWDRHVKVTSGMREEMRRLVEEEGYSYSQVGQMFHVKAATVKYNVNPEYRAKVLSSQTGRHTGKRSSLMERVAYKKRLVMNDVQNIEVSLD